MRKSYLVFLIIIGVFLISCSSENEKDLMSKAQTQLREGSYAEALSSLEKITNEFPKTSEAGTAFLEMAKLYQGRAIKNVDDKESFLKAVEYYQVVYNEYPDLKNNDGDLVAPGALFMCGFLLANEINDIETAEKTYNLFLEKYPDHELAGSAKVELENLGLTPEEILLKAMAQPK